MPVPPLRSYQREVAAAVLASVRDGAGHSFSLMVSRQGGKNELSAQLELALLLSAAGSAVDAVKCAPTFQPQGRVSMKRLLDRARDLRAPAHRDGYNIVRLGQARQVFLGAGEQTNVVGHTASLLLECDEAQDVSADKFTKDFRPMAASTAATTVYYGTAWLETDLLAEVKAQHLEQEQRDGIRRHFEYDWQAVAAENPAYRQYVESERTRLGDDHPLFRTQYRLLPLAGGGRMFGPAQLTMLAAGTHQRLHSTTAEQRRAHAYVAGLDVGGEALRAGADPDSTVLTVARVTPPLPLSPEPVLELVEQVAWQGAPHAELAGALARLLRDVWAVRRVSIDATGMGEGLASALAALPGGPEVDRVRLSEERKSSLGFGLQAAVGGGRLTLWAEDGSPERRATLDQARLARVSYRPNRRMAWSVAEADGHDDHLMSLALTVAAAADVAPRSARGRLGDGSL